MKDYLNAQEMNDVMLIGILLDKTVVIREEWDKRGNLTKEEHKTLKTAQTYLIKFYNSLISRLNTKEVKKMMKRTSDFELKIIDKYTLRRLQGTWQEEMKIAHVDREEFEDFCDQIMQIKCKGCKKHFSQCILYDIFYNNFVPESGWNLENCRYAYTEISSKKEEKRQEDIDGRNKQIYSKRSNSIPKWKLPRI